MILAELRRLWLVLNWKPEGQMRRAQATALVRGRLAAERDRRPLLSCYEKEARDRIQRRWTTGAGQR